MDRRRIELVDDDLPAIPHHHETQRLAINEAVALVERVRASAERHAAAELGALARSVTGIGAIALRVCPELPPTVPERLADYRARNVADWVMYRKALASAAESRGWRVDWYDSKSVIDSAARRLQIADFDAHFISMRKTLGPPWNHDYKLAMAAAIAAAS